MANWERERYPYRESRRFGGPDIDDDREGNGHRGYQSRDQWRSGWETNPPGPRGWTQERAGERYPEYGYGAAASYGSPAWAAYRTDWEPRLERSMRREAREDEWGTPAYRSSSRTYGRYGYRSDYGAMGRGRREPFGHVGRGPKGYRPSDDRIRDQINEHLTMHPEVDASEVEVRVDNGKVTLTGTVEDRHEKRLAEDIAEEVFGVDDVKNELDVRRGFFASLMGDRDDEKDTATAGERVASRTARTAQ